eukprot:m.13752 g.13752  ORF g.13752 m.13752 type:complete len:142 (+) comp25192_c0_seq2:2265-2690(+)
MIDEETISKLVKVAHEAKETAYSPYSRFHVGAALLSKNGDRIFTGCNVENASYSLTICAERTAIVKAVSEGVREFKAIAVASDTKDKFLTPCGACRQVLCEFGPEMIVVLTTPDMATRITSVAELLPNHFGPGDLDLERVK